jgi:DNA-binding response OmpR family regulator
MLNILLVEDNAGDVGLVRDSSQRQTDRELVLLAGAKEYIPKPTELEDFIHTVHDVLERCDKHQIGG